MALQYSGTRYAIFRKALTTLKRNTLPTFQKVMDSLGVVAKYNASEFRYTFDNGSVIYFIEADISKDPDMNKMKGLELTAAGIDEANEVAEEMFNILTGRIGRENVIASSHRGEQRMVKVPEFIFLTCNPAECWVKDRFYEPWRKKNLKKPYFFLQALPNDNPWLTKEYLDGLEHLPEAEYNRYVKGNWDYAEDPNQLIPYSFIKNALTDYIDTARFNKEYMGVDVSRTGNDSTVYTFIRNNTLYSVKGFKKQMLDVTANKLILYANEKEMESCDVGVDVVGIGAGVVDICLTKNFKVRPFTSGDAPLTTAGHFTFKNCRAEAYWKLREDLRTGRLKILDIPEMQPVIKDLLKIRYLDNDKVYQMESKKDIKKRLGRNASPDYADSLVICNYLRETGRSGLGGSTIGEFKETVGETYMDVPITDYIAKQF